MVKWATESLFDVRVILTKSAFFGNHYIPQHRNHSPIFFLGRYFENDRDFFRLKICAGFSTRWVNCLVNP